MQRPYRLPLPLGEGTRVLQRSVFVVSMILAVFVMACSAVPGVSPTRAAHPDWPDKLTLGLFGGDDAEAVIEGNKPIADWISQKTGLPVDLFTGTSYSAVIEAMRAKRVDGMSVGPFSYLLAVQEANAEALAIGVTTTAENAKYDPSIRPAYFSVISVKKGNGISKLEDLRGKSLNFVDPASTSGHLVPKTELLKIGINTDTDLKTVFAGSHPTSVLALWNGKSDAAASTEATLYNLAKNNQIEFCGFPDKEVGKDRTPAEIQAIYDACPDGKIVPIHYSDPIPNTPIAVRADLPADLKAAIRDALLTVKDQPDLVAKTKRWYIDPHEERGLPTLDAYYNPLRDIAKFLNLDLKTLD
jgi:phosphonate transport system substrate-binding protein